ncbi:uncharacterized protein ISCGN_022362 [Ixodes scapularis]
MERLKSKRTVRRSQNTRLINEATAVLETADLATLTSLLERLATSNNELRQTNIETEDHISDGDLVAEYTAVVEYDGEATRMIAVLGSRAATLREKERQPPPPPSVSTQSATATGETAQANRAAGVKLPKLRLQTLNGDIGGWQSFWEQFSSAIHDNESVPRCQKFHYLRTLVTGPAAAAIAGLQATDACYDDAIEILSGRFGDRRRIEQDHLAKLRTLPSVSSSNDTRCLRRIYDHLQINIRGLKALGVGSDTYSTHDQLYKGRPAALAGRGKRAEDNTQDYNVILPPLPTGSVVLNTVFLHADVKGRPYRVEDFRDALIRLALLPEVLALGAYQMNHVWAVTFKNDEGKKKMLATPELTVKGRRCIVIDPSHQDVRVKLHWLLFSVADGDVREALAPYGKVIEVAREKWRVDGCQSVGTMTRTAVLRLKAGITCDDIPHQLRVGGELALVVVPGRAPLCLRCQQTGHIRKECRVPRCNVCRRFGHEGAHCVRT